MFGSFDFDGVSPGQVKQFEMAFSEVHVSHNPAPVFELIVGKLVDREDYDVVEALAVDGQWVSVTARKAALDNIERLMALFP
jgi:hypothetical protein